MDPPYKVGQGLGTVLMGNFVLLEKEPKTLHFLQDIRFFVIRCALREGVDYCNVGTTAEVATQHQLKVIAILRRLGFFISYKKLDLHVGR